MVWAGGKSGKWQVATWVSGSSAPRLAAPSLTTSARRVMVATEDWAAWASFSWLAAAFCTSTFVSSTSTFAVFRMPSLRVGMPAVSSH